VNVQLALITGAIVPLVAWLTSHYGGRMTRNFHTLFRRVGAFNARLEENVGGMRVVQAFANEDHERALFAEDNDRYRETKLAAYKMMAASIAMSYLGMRFTQVVVMIVGTWLVINGDLTNGGFIGFLLLVTVFFRPIEKINAVIEVYPKGIAGFRSYLDLLNTEPDIVDRPGAIDMPDRFGEIRYENIGFSYATGKPVLTGIDLTIRAGETIAFVGPSGAGKTTICSLLPRFYEPTAGCITVDGTDIRDLKLGSLRAHIGIVQQDVFLFAGTIRQNIAYGRLGASDEDIRRAVTSARLDSLVDSLPDGLDTVIGEARREALRRPEAAAGDCPHLPEGSSHPDPRRGHLGAGHGNRARDPGLARRPFGRPDDADDRAPSGHHPPRRPDRGGDERRDRGGRPSRRPCRGRRPLPTAARHPVRPVRGLSPSGARHSLCAPRSATVRTPGRRAGRWTCAGSGRWPRHRGRDTGTRYRGR